MVIARIVGCDGWLVSGLFVFYFLFFSHSNLWIWVVGGVVVDGFVQIWWCFGWLVEWWWVGFCWFVGVFLDLLRSEIMKKKKTFILLWNKHLKIISCYFSYTIKNCKMKMFSKIFHFETKRELIYSNLFLFSSHKK